MSANSNTDTKTYLSTVTSHLFLCCFMPLFLPTSLHLVHEILFWDCIDIVCSQGRDNCQGFR